MAKNSQEYWAQRRRQDKIKVINTGEKGIDNLKRLLLLNLKDVERQIKEFYEKYGDNPAEEMSRKDFEKYKAKLSRMAKANPQDKTLQKLAKQDIPKYKIDRLRALQGELQMQLTEATNGQEKGIYNTLDDVSKVSQSVLAKTMQASVGLKFNTIASRKMKQILMSDWSGANWSDRLWHDREKVGRKLTEILEKGVVQGTSLQKMSRELRDVTGQSFNNAFRLIRTETSHIDGQVTLEGYKQAGKELGLEYYEYDAFLDSRTSELCRNLDKKRFKVSDAEVGVNYPPMHPNCRSTTQLVLDEDFVQDVKEDSKNKAQNIEEKELLYKPELTKTSQNLINSLGDKYASLDIEYKKTTKERDELGKVLIDKYKKIQNSVNRTKLVQEYKILRNDWMKLYNKTIELNNKKIDMVAKNLNFKNGGIITIGKTTNTTKNVAMQLQKDLSNVIHQDLIKGLKLETNYTKSDRNYFSSTENKIFINKDTKRLTAIHETMHWLEHNNKDISSKVQEFLEYRTKGEKAQKLRDLVPNSNYEKDEIAKKDNFFRPYCGKIYQDGATEILSMGLQEIYENAIDFSKNDPEYFNFVIDIIQNRI